MARPTLVWTAPATRPAHSGDTRSRLDPGFGFTSQDRIALTCWMQRADIHGYRRMLIEDAPEEGPYVLIYAHGRDWARWGIARSHGHITVWDCGTGADLGKHDTMFAALGSLPPAASARANITAPPATTSGHARLIVVNPA